MKITWVTNALPGFSLFSGNGNGIRLVVAFEDTKTLDTVNLLQVANVNDG